MKKEKILVIRLVSTVIFAGLLFYLIIPPINIQSFGFWSYLIIVLLFYIMTSSLKLTRLRNIIIEGRKPHFSKPIWLLVLLVIVALIILINLILSPIFSAKNYAKRINVDETVSFEEGVNEVDFSAIPLLDKDSSQKLGDRVMGQMSELVSQFYVSDLYTQINYNNDIVRVTPLEYSGIIKYFTNRSKGIKGYITVNSVNGKAELTKLDKGMKYMPSAMFNERLERKLRLTYPTSIFDEASFEIDNDGNPYWIVPIIKYKGVEMLKEIKGVVILNPITGKSKKYDIGKVPSWVDHVYSADLIIDQIDDWGLYQKGFINSLFGQKGVTQTTKGYNYMVMNDDVYLYTGITSVSSDESNLGFILCNMRTKETNFYSAPGAEEYSAMRSAEGQVQQMSYTATFPLLINLNNKPTYLISLKDNAGLVKMYAFVDVADYQQVVVTDATLGIEEASKNYLATIKVEYKEDDLSSKTITVASINMALIDGNSYYYIIDSSGLKYRADINIGKFKLPFINNGEIIEISYGEEKDVTEITKIK